MFKKFFVVVSFSAALLAAAMTVRAEEPKKAAEAANKLVGTWKLVSAKYGGRESSITTSSTMLKHITPEQFMWVNYGEDGKISRAAGGSYSLKGENYEETPSYGISSDFSLIGGKTHSFKCKVEGNNWHHNGKLASGLTIEEVWERVEKK